MANQCINKEEGELIRQLNGQIVMEILEILNNNATEGELTQQIVTFTGHPRKDVHHEVKRILDDGVATGFIMKNKNIYSLPCSYEVDSGKRCESAEEFLDNCLTQLEELYPDFDYEGFLRSRARSSETSDEVEKCECSTDDEACSDPGERSDTDLLSTEVGTGSTEDTGRIAEIPGTTGTGFCTCPHDDSSCDAPSEADSGDEMDETQVAFKITVKPKAKKRLFEAESDDESCCEVSPEKKKRC